MGAAPKEISRGIRSMTAEHQEGLACMRSMAVWQDRTFVEMLYTAFTARARVPAMKGGGHAQFFLEGWKVSMAMHLKDLFGERGLSIYTHNSYKPYSNSNHANY